MNYKNKKKLFNVALIFALIFSLITPFQNVSKAADVLTVAQAIANNSGTGKTVEGYIIGTTNNGPSYQYSSPFSASNLAIADSPNETDRTKIMPVQLPSGSAVRAALNLVDHPENLGKKVRITGNLEAYFTVAGLKSPTAYAFVTETDPTPVTKVEAVTATPGAGAVAAGTQVTLATATPDAKIYYTTDGTTDPSATSTEYTTPIVINENTTIKAIAVKDGLTNSDVASFTYTVLTEQTIADVRLLSLNSNVMISGIVTAIYTSGGQNNVYIQDNTAGIIVRGASLDSKVKVGDEIQAVGVLKSYYGMAQVEATVANVSVKTANAGVPAAQLVTSNQLDENVEAELVTIHNVTIGAKDANGNFAVTDANGNLVIKPVDSSLLVTGKEYDVITGVINYDFNEYKIVPRNADDIIEDSTITLPVKATPGSGYLNAGDTVTLTSRTAGATIHYTVDGSEPTTASAVYSQPIAINVATTIKAMAVANGLSNSEVTTFEYLIQNGPIRIHDIQGARHTSILNGSNVTDVEGVVTYVDGTSRFYIQDLNPDTDIETSEGIMVFKSGHGLVPGQVVKVTGKVTEFYGDGYDDKASTDLSSTQIEASVITNTGTTAPLPAPVVIGVDRIAPTSVIEDDAFGSFDAETDGIDFWESLEGMYVKLNDAKIVAPQRYGDVWVVPGNVATNTDANGLKISANDYNPERISLDFNDDNYIAKTGDSFQGAINGVISYGYGNFKVLTKKADLPTKVEGPLQREVAAITPADDKLTIASYNVENFSANNANTSDEKVTHLAQAVVSNMKTPDIIGLVEVQDNDGETDSGNVDAAQSAQRLIDKIAALGGPTYLFTDIAPENKKDGGAPGGNIRVGFLYNPTRVTLTQGAPKGTATQSVGFENGMLTLNPGRIDPTNTAFNSSRKPLAAQFDFQGKSVIVVANHFNSKGGDQALFGKNQPPVLGSEVQRLKIAEIVNGFVKDVKQKDPYANVVLLGDFNDFEFTPALTKLKGQELTNMIDLVPANERYTYSYQGNAQVLDHILVSNNMVANTTVDILHINSSFMEHHGRASDHDPVIIQTKLQGEILPPVTPPAHTKFYNLNGFTTKKLTVNNQGADITVGATTIIREGIILKSSYAKLSGEGLKNTVIIIAPVHPGAVIDLSGVEVKEVIIDNANVSQIRGAENVQKWTVSDDVDTSNIKFTNVGGEVFTSPFFSPAPVDPVTPPTVPPVDNGTVSTYYANAAGLTGTALKSALYNIIKVQTKITYDQAKEALKDTDEDPNNPNNVILLYKGTSQAKSTFGGGANDWNREHVWAQSHGSFGTVVGPGTDIHHLRPTDASVNSSRGNLDFDNGGTLHNECTECRYDGDSWEPPNRVKGDIARMLMYMAVRYEGNGEIDLELVNSVNTSGPYHGKLSTLLQWHAQDPVDAFEMRRNNVIYEKYQGNRNPFIDHPEWANLIWPAS